MSILYLAKTHRFRIVRELGEGGMGIVYEAFDRKFGERIALKTLLSSQSEALFRFKQEFRSFRDIEHPNLVSLGELYGEGRRWFFTMDLIEGVDFIRYVMGATSKHRTTSFAPVERSLNVTRLRESIVQLTRGLLELHATGKVHCDIKPSNVLVSEAGRVVVLDYGLATDILPQQFSLDVVRGTPVYMAPEQAAGLQVGPAADWYSVGVLLYEALTGRVPIEGNVSRVLKDKVNSIIRPPDQCVAVPQDLSDLCMELLAADPSVRADGPTILMRLGAPKGPPTVLARENPRMTATPHFVGRHRELSELDESLQGRETFRGSRIVLIHGEAGIGKSALVTEYLSNVRGRNPKAIVLSGVCCECESIPFNAVDSIVDALSHELAKFPQAIVRNILPRTASLLIHTFPVLERVPAIAELPRLPSHEILYQNKQLLSLALRNLFDRLARAYQLIISIDDLHWADHDSLLLLSDILRGTDGPPLLFIGTARTDANSKRTSPAAGFEHGSRKNIYLDRFDEQASRALVDSFSRHLGVRLEPKIDKIIQEGMGHPLFLYDLVRTNGESDAPQARTPFTSLDSSLWGRIRQLNATDRTLLELVTLSMAPVEPVLAVSRSCFEQATAMQSIKRLKLARLIRSTVGERGPRLLEPYHEQIRDVMRSRYTPERLKLHHDPDLQVSAAS